MKYNYIAYDPIDCNYELFKTEQEAKDFLMDRYLDDEELDEIDISDFFIAKIILRGTIKKGRPKPASMQHGDIDDRITWEFEYEKV